MDFDKLTQELDKLSFLQLGDENGTNDAETWLFDPAPEASAAKSKEEEEQNLEKWLKGAVDKVDFRTRSALSRKLEKKKRIKDKEKRRNNMESSLSMIEEASGESGPFSDREQRRRPRGEKENMAQRKCVSEAGGICSEDEEEEDDDEEYFDAPSSPKKLPLGGRNPAGQQSPRKTRNGTGPGKLGAVPRSAGGGGQQAGAGDSSKAVAAVQRSASKNIQKAASFDESPKEWRNLGEIERRAKEQERELQIELMRHRRDRLSANTADRAGATVSSHSRPTTADSPSSSTSSLLSGSGTGPSAYNQQQMASSKSVDFRSTAALAHNNTDQSSATSSRSNDGSLADLSGTSTSDQLGGQPLNSRLPLPRRPTVPGKTGIPAPNPKRAQRKLVAGSDVSAGSGQATADPAPMNDDECF